MSVDVEIVASLNTGNTVKGLLDIENQTAEAAKVVEKLNARYQSLNEQLKNTDPRAKDWNKLHAEVQKTNKALQDANKDFEELASGGRAATGSIKALQEELNDLTDQISRVAVGSDEFDQLSAKIRLLDGELATANQTLVGLSAEDKASRIGQLAGGLGSVAAAAALIGGEDSAIGEFFGGIESAVGIMVGLQGAIEAVEASKKLLAVVTAKNTIATGAEAVAMGANASAMGAQTVATGAATTASWAFNASLLANPIFWIVAVIMAVVAAFAIFSAATKTASAEHDKLNAQLERESKLIEANRQSRERANAEMENEISNKQKLISAEIGLLQATANRSKEQEARLRALNKELNQIDEQQLDILGNETQKRVAENTKLLHAQIVAAKKGLQAVFQEDWGFQDFDYSAVNQYFEDVDAMQSNAANLYKLANEAATEDERKEYLKRAKVIEEQVTQKTARILSRLEQIKGTLGSDASEQMEKVIADIQKFGERANESADLMSKFQNSIDNFSTDKMVAEFEKETKAQEELAKAREKARDKWNEFIKAQNALREELRRSRMDDQERELYDLNKWFEENKKLTEKDAKLRQDLIEVNEKKKQEILDKYAEQEATKTKERADSILAIERQLLADQLTIDAMRISASVKLAEEETNLLLESWEKRLEEARNVSVEELNELKQSFARRRDVIVAQIEQEHVERLKASEIAKNDEIAEAEERVKNLIKNGHSEIEAQKMLSDLKLSIVAKYNAEVEDAENELQLARRQAQKDFNDAEAKAEADHKAKLLEIQEAHANKIVDSLGFISAALMDSVGQFEGVLGRLGQALAVGVGNLGSAVNGFADQVKKLKASTAEGVELTPEEIQALKESTAMAVSAVVGAAGEVAQNIVSAIAENNAQKAQDALNELESNKERELQIIQNNLNAGTISQEQAEEQRRQIEYKAALEKYEIEKQQFENEKKSKIAAASIAGLTGAVSAFAGAMQLGPIAGPIVGGILAAAVAGMTALNISNIKKTKFGGTPPTMATSSFGGSSVPLTAVDPSNFLETGSKSTNEPGANQSGNSTPQNQQITVKAVVVETDVTSVQNQVSAIENHSEFN